MSPRTLVIGYGNPLRGDDGVGPYVAQAVAARNAPQVHTLAAHQLLPEHAAALTEAGRVIFVDALVTADAERLRPRLERLEPDRTPTGMGHHATPGRLLALAETLGRRPEAWLIVIPVACVAVGEELSACARRNAESALRLLAERFLAAPDPEQP